MYDDYRYVEYDWETVVSIASDIDKNGYVTGYLRGGIFAGKNRKPEGDPFSKYFSRYWK